MAEEYLRAHIDEPFALDKLIEITGSSASTLLRDFRKRYGMPPLQYLKNCRLEAARGELESSVPGETSVTEVATRYGFYHLGRFAGYYKTTFGELPSETLHCAH
jgi:transcriptional regulator GlxA family with amidase domain